MDYSLAYSWTGMILLLFFLILFLDFRDYLSFL